MMPREQIQMTLGMRPFFHPDCSWGCGNKIVDVGTEEYINYLSRIVKKTNGICQRCPLCEIEFVEMVFGLTIEQVKNLEEKWVK